MSDCYVFSNKIIKPKNSIDIPGDKSISHRAIIIGSLANNTSVFANFLFSEDCVHSMKIFQNLGVEIKADVENKSVEIHGLGLFGFKAPNCELYVGNSGTSIRLISGVLVGQPFVSEITGDASICSRPMKRIVEPLKEFGADIFGREEKENLYPPLIIKGKSELQAIEYKLPVASAQVKSAILFAALYCKAPTIIHEPVICRDHTEKMLGFYGADIKTRDGKIFVSGEKMLSNPTDTDIIIPGDFSSAAFFIVLGLLLPDMEIVLNNVGLNPTRSYLLDILREMGAQIDVESSNVSSIELIGNIRVKSSRLNNINIPEEKMAYIIDEVPILAVAAMFAKGRLKISGAKELRVKESDRIVAIVNMVKAFGGEIKEYEDGFEINGGSVLNDAEIDSCNDHRIAMSAIIAAVIANKKATIKNCDCINTSFPSFFSILEEFSVNYQIV
jgi:3-phosphoshikimate 1-carboxyvinyltransferase